MIDNWQRATNKQIVVFPQNYDYSYETTIIFLLSLSYYHFRCSMPCQSFGDKHDGTSSQAVFSFHGNKHGNSLRLLFSCKILPFGATRGCLLVRGVPRFHGLLKLVCHLDPFFHLSSFDHNSTTNNDNQTFIVYS